MLTDRTGVFLFAIDTDKNPAVPKGRVRAHYVRLETYEFEADEFLDIRPALINPEDRRIRALKRALLRRSESEE